jgi:hypothetical protein
LSAHHTGNFSTSFACGPLALRCIFYTFGTILIYRAQRPNRMRWGDSQALLRLPAVLLRGPDLCKAGMPFLLAELANYRTSLSRGHTRRYSILHTAFSYKTLAGCVRSCIPLTEYPDSRAVASNSGPVHLRKCTDIGFPNDSAIRVPVLSQCHPEICKSVSNCAFRCRGAAHK